MRLFTAIDFSDETRDSLTMLMDQLRPLARIRWSPLENLHITTKFIGDWPEARLDEMKQTLAKVTGVPLEIGIRGLGWFPNADRPRVLWAGVEGGDPLRKLAREIEGAVVKLGVPVDKRDYSPHLTLARISDSRALAALRKAVDQARVDFGCFQATSFYLYLSAQGRYTKLAEFPL